MDIILVNIYFVFSLSDSSAFSIFRNVHILTFLKTEFEGLEIWTEV